MTRRKLDAVRRRIRALRRGERTSVGEKLKFIEHFQFRNISRTETLGVFCGIAL